MIVTIRQAKNGYILTSSEGIREDELRIADNLEEALNVVRNLFYPPTQVNVNQYQTPQLFDMEVSSLIKQQTIT